MVIKSRLELNSQFHSFIDTVCSFSKQAKNTDQQADHCTDVTVTVSFLKCACVKKYSSDSSTHLCCAVNMHILHSCMEASLKKLNLFLHFKVTWRSFAGFQSMSYRNRREAPTRFSPTPPALELNRKTSAQIFSSLICQELKEYHWWWKAVWMSDGRPMHMTVQKNSCIPKPLTLSQYTLRNVRTKQNLITN